ncbi:uncharacterized protein M6B38_275075 [Iris pallida]|uniref:PWWP domain-containing protein n=1 Tax=Iris pallida TaxID=29817 RepID=A0AAX6I672_IRIPA|nr:uncharacterized protein M6B38_275075 [Iris pallida]
MISAANKYDVDRNPSSSAADLSFFGMEISRASSDLDPKSRVPEEVDDRSPSPESRFSGSDDPSLSVHGFKTGDMVWGKVKSHPWWPGHIFSEAFASPSVRRTRREGHVLVAFFGDSSYGWFDPSELVHFAPTFLDKSRQTASRGFVKALEESVDESSRRAALGLSCMCRNPYNFRPTRVPGYRAVDVPGYERGGIYSLGRIRKAREEFVPEESAAFLWKVALAPTSAEPRDLEWIKRVAQLLAFRKARFEEFDETYAQAFGQQLVRHPQDNLENEPEKFAPKVALAPLSGPLVIAEALGGSSSNNKKKKKKKKDDGSSLSRRFSATATKSSSAAAAAAAAAASSKKKEEDKYLLKRRDEHPISNPLPDASYPPPPLQPTQPGATPPPETDRFVLPKRESESIRVDDGGDQKPKPMSPPAPPLPAAAPATTTMPAEPYVPIPVVDHDSTQGIDASQPDREGKSVEAKLKPKKKKKKRPRPREDVDDKGETLQAKATKTKKKKKKKIEGLGSMASTLKKLAMGIEEDADAQPEEPPTDASDSNAPPAASPPQIDPSCLDLPQLLDDLAALAMDPFYGVDCDATATACWVFLKFRSLMYQKSSVLPLPSEGDDQEARPRKPSSPPPPPKEPKEKKEKKEKAVKVKLGSLFKRSSDPTKSGRKRPLSDRQEESSAKRSKKLDQLKSLAAGKKATLAPQTAPQGHKDSNAALTSANSSLPVAAAAAAAAAADPAGKPERQEPLLQLPPKKESPTNLILKFPPRSTLPSVANLKARFARFGPIVVDRCRVIWNTHSCRVQFRYKADALEAYSYVRDNNLFGQIQVRYSVKEAEMPGPQPDPGRRLPEPQPVSSSQSRPGNGRPSHLPLKSILKRPGGEDAGKENQRVKFKLTGDVERASAPVNASSPDVPSLPLPSSSLTSSTRAPKSSTDFLPPRTATFAPQFPLLPRPVPSQPPASMLPRSFEPPPLPLRPQNRPPVSQFGEPRLRQQVLRYGGAAEERSKNDDDTDVTHKLLSLMLRCNDIVTTLKSLPGFVSYRPL